MPPKPKKNREDIIDAAYELMEEKGIDAVVAREVGKRLDMTVSPIFTCFGGMDELKGEVYRRAQKEFAEYLAGCLDYFPAFKEFGLRWVSFAKEHPHTYEMLFMRRDFQGSDEGAIDVSFLYVIPPMTDEIKNAFGIGSGDAEELIQNMIFFSQGISSRIVSGFDDISQEAVGRRMSMICLGFVAGVKIMDDSIDTEMMKGMILTADKLPEKKK